MNELQVFNSPEFGEIRTITQGGKTLFCGSDVAKALGYKNPRKALSDHCRGVTKCYAPTTSGTQEMNFIPKGDVFRLAAKSELPGAEKFESWIFDEVLPSIHETGAYIAPQAQPAALDAAAMQSFAAAMDTLSGMVQTMARMIDTLEQAPGRAALPALTGGDSTFDDLPVSIKPPSNKMRRKWMSTASDKLNALAEKCGLPSSTVLHRLYQEMEDEQGVILSEVRLKALEEHQLTDCSFLLAIFYDAPLREWFERRVDRYLTPETPVW